MLSRKALLQASLLSAFLFNASVVFGQQRTDASFIVSYSSRNISQAHGLVILKRTWPAPAITSATAQFSLPCSGMCRLEIYALTGRLIFAAQAPSHELRWDGRDTHHRPLANGTYLFRIRAQEHFDNEKHDTNARLFEDVTATHLPQDTSQTRSVAAGDLDGDGDPDIVAAHNTFRYGRQPQALINNGNGVFRDETRVRFPALLTLTNDVDMVDVDRDGDLDIYLANTNANGPPAFAHVLLINDGAGHFQDETAQRIFGNAFLSENVAFGDIDQDRDLDLLMAVLDAFAGVRLLLNDGKGVFTDSTQRRLDTSAYGAFDLTLLDVNLDHRLDLVLANFPITITAENGNPLATLSGRNAVFINQGHDSFRDETAMRNIAEVQDLTVEIAPGDVDRDGDVDLFFSNIGFSPEETANRLLINDGQGVFTDEGLTRLPVENVYWNNDADFADVNGDGALDLFLASVEPGVDASDLLYINDGRGFFQDRSPLDLPEAVDFSASAVFGDFDLDTDMDLFVGNHIRALDSSLTAQNRMYQNQTKPAAVEESGHAPQSLALSASYPNPFRARTTILFKLPRQSMVRLEINNLMGQVIRTLIYETRPSGEHHVVWDGRNEEGRWAPEGICFCRVRIGTLQQTRRIVLMH